MNDHINRSAAEADLDRALANDPFLFGLDTTAPEPSPVSPVIDQQQRLAAARAMLQQIETQEGDSPDWPVDPTAGPHHEQARAEEPYTDPLLALAPEPRLHHSAPPVAGGSSLSKHNISIVQLGTAQDIRLRGCYITCGQTSINNVAYIVKHSLLHMGVDSFPVHLAGYYDRPIVALYSTLFKECCGPYWGNKEHQVLLEPTRMNNTKPSFSLSESPKTINTILPETVDKFVCDLLNIEFNFNYRTILIGNAYNSYLLESVPDQIPDPKSFGIENVIMRMGYIFDENILVQQLQRCPCTIVTNRPINPRIIQQFKSAIHDIVYIIEENNDPNFVEMLMKLSIKYTLISFMDAEKINTAKLNYMNYGLIIDRGIIKPSFIDKFKNRILYYKSNKILLSKGKLFPSYVDYLKDNPINDAHI